MTPAKQINALNEYHFTFVSESKITLFFEPADKKWGSGGKSEFVSRWRGVLHLFK
jgi:hypothetical protein